MSDRRSRPAPGGLTPAAQPHPSRRALRTLRACKAGAPKPDPSTVRRRDPPGSGRARPSAPLTAPGSGGWVFRCVTGLVPRASSTDHEPSTPLRLGSRGHRARAATTRPRPTPTRLHNISPRSDPRAKREGQPLCRLTSAGGKMTRIGWGSRWPSICSRSRRVACSAISPIGLRIVVSGRVGALGDAEVVVAGDGDVVGDPAAGRGQHAQGADGHQVGGDDEAVEVGVAREQLGGGLPPPSSVKSPLATASSGRPASRIAARQPWSRSTPAAMSTGPAIVPIRRQPRSISRCGHEPCRRRRCRCRRRRPCRRWSTAGRRRRTGGSGTRGGRRAGRCEWWETTIAPSMWRLRR